MPNRYPYSELEVFIAGYDRGRAFLDDRVSDSLSEPEELARDEIASRVQVQQFEERVREYVDALKADAYIEIRQDCVDVAL